MKRVIGGLVLLAVLYAIYMDITVGTLPKATQQDAIASSSIAFLEVRIEPGDTVLSIIEELTGFPKNIAIDQMIKDFTSLNGGIAPEQIRPGEVYKIPIYASTSEE
ncbi:hypothetical protein OEV98_09985 [Caldibacillus lycopersici]|uniref:LysM domain-containing protein n=1 Tax=Perspicuibacillus lycopersici TaxID=1325689 RepID=A0AAE3IVY7_9BACI|nr:hypothetical protein [Perspicuibacillus lycopersici]MCU9613889.1 hypothetical protein [Perspicuibacillus lycopersici]